MTTTTTELCGHRWVGRPGRCPHGGRGGGHRCERPAGHDRDMLLRQPQQCRCRCGATTTVWKETTR